MGKPLEVEQLRNHLKNHVRAKITYCLLGDRSDSNGTLTFVGDDFITIDDGPGEPWIIPLASIKRLSVISYQVNTA